MSAGGINVQQPLVGAPPNAVGVQPGGQQQLAAANAAPPMATAASVPTAFMPPAGQQAGSVPASGGLAGDVSIPRTVAIAAGVGGEALQQQGAVAAARQQVAGQQVVDPALAQGPATTAPRGPAAWSEGWAKQFKDAGAPAEIIQQLTFTGAMGADEAQLQQMLAQIKGEIDTQLAQFAHEHPDAFKKLRGNPDADRSMIAQIAAASNAGQLPKDQLEQMVDSIGKSQGKMLFDMFVKPMVVWSLIPGWGALRIGFAPFTGGKDILTGEKMFGDPMSTTFTVLAGIGGGMTLWNNAKGAMQVAQGHRMIQAGGDAAVIAAREGLDGLSTGRKLWSYVPGTQLNQQVSGLSRLDDWKAGLASLSGDQRMISQNLYDKVVKGDVLMWGDSASKWTKMGYQPNHRGFIMGHVMGKKAAVNVTTHGSRPGIVWDGRTVGKVTAAHAASVGLDFVDDTKANGFLKTKLFGSLDPSNAGALKNLKDLHLGQASQQLLDAKAIARPTGIGGILGNMRPGALQDSVWAADNLAKYNASGVLDDLSRAHGWAAVSKPAKFGIFGALAAAGGYFMVLKPQLDAKKEAAQQAAAPAAGGQAGAAVTGGGAIDPSQLSAQDQVALRQFAALPAEQQAQVIQQQYGALQQAMATPNMTAEQQQQVAAAQAELQLLMQVSQGAGAGTGAATPAAPAAAMPTGPAAAVAAPQFTAQGLGLS